MLCSWVTSQKHIIISNLWKQEPCQCVSMKDRNNNSSNEESSEKSKRAKCKKAKDKLPDLPHLLLSLHVMDEFSVRFCTGSLVWAKVSGHPDPPWPGVSSNRGHPWCWSSTSRSRETTFSPRNLPRSLQSFILCYWRLGAIKIKKS